MTRFACNYAIVRFMPYVETGEFANVGVLLWIPKQKTLLFKLLRRKYGRITQFFEELDKQVYLKTMADLDAELHRIEGLLQEGAVVTANSNLEYGFHKGIFEEIIRPRETIVRFSEQRAILSENPKETLTALYDYYVGRNFVNKEYQEGLMVTGIKRLLEQENLATHFKKRKVGDKVYSVSFPFVEERNNKAIRVIKPLFLGQADSTAIIEHGGHWRLKVEQLRKRQLLQGPVLFPVKGPEDAKAGDHRHEAFEETRHSLEGQEIQLVDYEEHRKILDFATQILH
ncbi:MAG: Protein of unknown function (DUF3037) [Marinobacter excellens HL-55]|uniref:DUF3037 domain-containing protein n=1 Tax=Marinobacter excellens HL-55 TaxID=1305731 RepID=A0A0P7Z3Q0_9GAMM|nr:MAG: Protein of unknown function (DUF3037) [Marinobacter excellens HL-55]